MFPNPFDPAALAARAGSDFGAAEWRQGPSGGPQHVRWSEPTALDRVPAPMKLAYVTTLDKVRYESDLARLALRADELGAIVGGSEPDQVALSIPLGGIWIPLWGRLRYDPNNPHATFGSGELRVLADGCTIAAADAPCFWLAIVASTPSWRRALAGVWNFPPPEPLLLPGTYTADRGLRKYAVELIRQLESEPAGASPELLLAHVARLHRRQEHAIARCPGRTYTQRRLVFARLQRVRSYIAANCHLDIGSQGLAELASLSPCYFIRTFRDVFLQTPHAYLIERRLRLARLMLSTTPLGITEIAIASGFENRSAFARMFRKHFGTTAGDVRRAIAHASYRMPLPPRENVISATPEYAYLQNPAANNFLKLDAAPLRAEEK